MAFSSFINQLRDTAQKLSGSSSTSSNPPGASSPSSLKGPTLKGLEWIGLGKSIRLGKEGLELRDPFAYFFVDPPNADSFEPAAVDLRQPIATQAHVPVDRELPYWPQYGQLTANQRRIYLDWLASGRVSAPPELGYAFLFIYGLERRALIDHQDVKLVFKIVMHLRQVFARSGQQVSRSFENYTSTFAWFLLLREPSIFAVRHFEALAKSMPAWDDDCLAMAISWLARANAVLPDWFAFTLARQLPRSQRSVVAKRAGEELEELFIKRYREQFGAGIELKNSKRDRKYSYRPSSAALSSFEVAGPNPMGVSSQFNVLSDLWNACIADLKRFSSAVAGESGEELTVETWKKLPEELQSDVDHPFSDQFAKFIEANTGDSPHTMVTARSLATIAGIAAETKLTVAACRKMAETVEDVGYCIEPDVRITATAYDDEEPVILFLNLDNGTVDAGRYTAASIMLCTGLALAAADGSTDEGELSLLTQQIDSGFDLSDHEKRRLGMLRALRAAKGSDIADVGKPLKRLPKADRERVARFAVALVSADGVVTKEELKAVRRLYTAMGLERDDADAALASLTGGGSVDEPVTVLPATSGAPGEAIPRPPSTAVAGGLKLDRAAIAAILKDTLEVSRMLADAMNIPSEQVHVETVGVAVETVAAPSEASTAPMIESTSDTTVPTRYAAFYQIVITRPSWPRAELAALAKEHGLMLSGAVEAINDWSTDQHGGPILYEDDQQFTLEPAYLN